MKGRLPSSLMVQVSSTDLTTQYSLSQVVGSVSVLRNMGIGRNFVQCVAWEFGDDNSYNDSVLVRLLFGGSQFDQNAAINLSDTRVQFCRDGVTVCSCFLEINVVQIAGDAYFVSGSVIVPLPSTDSPLAELAGYSTDLTLLKLDVGPTLGAFSIIDEEP